MPTHDEVMLQLCRTFAADSASISSRAVRQTSLTCSKGDLRLVISSTSRQAVWAVHVAALEMTFGAILPDPTYKCMPLVEAQH